MRIGSLALKAATALVYLASARAEGLREQIDYVQARRDIAQMELVELIELPT